MDKYTVGKTRTFGQCLIVFALPQIIMGALTIGISKYPLAQTIQIVVAGPLLILGLMKVRKG
jgi:hypothetical protein